MAITKEEILEAISEMSVMEVVDLISAMEEKFGVSAAAPVTVAATETVISISAEPLNSAAGIVTTSPPVYPYPQQLTCILIILPLDFKHKMKHQFLHLT